MKVKNKKTEYTPFKKISDTNVVVMWDYTPIFKSNAKGEKIETPLAVWQEKRFDYVPTLNEIKELINGYYNKNVEETILSGFVWKGMQVWLSTENQFNYKAAYDLALQTNGASLPMTFKFSNDTENVYYTFQTIDEITDFYMKAIKHIQTSLETGWLKKDKINWNLYMNS